jgi:hypothetical protein
MWSDHVEAAIQSGTANDGANDFSGKSCALDLTRLPNRPEQYAISQPGGPYPNIDS